MFKVTSSGDFNNIEKYLKKQKEFSYLKNIEKYCKEGVKNLIKATPVDTGLTAMLWGYEIEVLDGIVNVYFKNTNLNQYVNIAVLLQLGHGTRNGGYVQGIDYINPALKPVFEDILKDIERELSK